MPFKADMRAVPHIPMKIQVKQMQTPLNGRVIILIGCFFLLSACSSLKNDEEQAEAFFQSGMTKMASNHLKSAIIEFKNAIHKNPRLAKAHFQLGLAYVSSHQVLSGFIQMRTAVRLDPQNDAFLNTYANLLFEHRYYSDAAKYFEKLVERKQESGLLFLLGTARLKAKHSEKAIETFNGILAGDPNNVPARIGLADALYNLNEINEAQKTLEETASTAEDNIEAQIALAGFYEKRKQYDLAEEKLRQIVHRFPNIPESHVAYGQYRVRREQLRDAYNIAEKALKSGIQHPTLYHIKAYLEYKNGEKKTALKDYERAVKLFPEDKTSWEFLGNYYRMTREYTRARAIYRKALEKWPNTLGLKLDIADMYYRDGRIKKAASILDPFLAEYPNNGRAHFLQGKLLRREGAKTEAKQQFLLAKKYDSDNPDAFYYYGLSLFEERQYENAKEEITTALNLKPGSIRALMILTEIYYRINDDERALTTVNKVLGLQPGDLDATLLRGKVNAHMKNHRAAIKDYQYVLARRTGTARERFRLAELYEAEGNPDRALKAYLAVADIYPDKSKPLAKMANIYLNRNQPKKAIGICNAFLKKMPGNLKIAMVKAHVLMTSRQYAQARRLLEHLTNTHPESEEPYLLLAAIALAHKHDTDKGIGFYQKAVQKNPDNPSGYIGLANAYENTGQFDQAEETYQRLIKFDPSNILALNNLAYLYARLDKKLDDALSLAMKAKKRAPNDPDIFDTLGLIHLKKGSLLLSRQYLEKAIAGEPNDAGTNFHFGVYHYRQNDFSAARTYFEKAVALGLGKEETKALNDYERAMRAVEEEEEIAGAYAEKGEPKEAITRYEKILQSIGFYTPVACKLSYLYADTGQNLDRAHDLAMKARAHRPEDPYLLDILGLIYLKKGSLFMAKRFFDEAVDISPGVGIYHYHLGMLYLARDDKKSAFKAFDQAIKLGLDKTNAESARRHMKKIDSEKGS